MTSNRHAQVINYARALLIEVISSLVLLAQEQGRFESDKKLNEDLRQLTFLVGPEHAEEFHRRARTLERELVLEDSTAMFRAALSNTLTDLERTFEAPEADERYVNATFEGVNEEDYITLEELNRAMAMLQNDAEQARIIIEHLEKRGVAFVIEALYDQPYEPNGELEKDLRRKVLEGDLTMSEQRRLFLVLELLISYEIDGVPVDEQLDQLKEQLIHELENEGEY